MADERARYFRRLRRLRRSARRWSVVGAGFAGAAAILTPYAGLGLPDAAWAAAAGGSLVLAGWRWADLRRASAQPAPPATDPALAAQRSRARLLAAVESAPGGRAALTEVRRQRGRFALRGSAAAAAWDRLDQASATLNGLSPRLTGMGGSAVLEAAVAEESLRDLAHRVAGVEKALRFAPPDAKPSLTEAHRDLTHQLNEGVSAYERLVAAAASYVAEDGRLSATHPSVSRLTEASDLLRGVASGLAEVRTMTPDPMRAAS
ncbi:phage shock envelope stress response protein PspM [Asanoa iriomotensis]|uniref:Uncharacterized protein n=1 Tax=Asanoa iriomotensis TaxID=234613 RepID=A0ABQ4CAW6_9ACTN|nr:hypothetical protein [Asanoa iriomotensis]GIF59910.1 hypothetical protein Air01nite_60050 [Asanoa iriomotensis]